MMKLKLVCILLVIGVGTNITFARNIGVHAGIRMNTSQIDYEGVDINRKLGFEGGASFRQPVVPGLGLDACAAVMYFNQEFALKQQIGENSGSTYNYREDNLKIPLSVEWKPAIGKVKPFLKAGLYASYALFGKMPYKDSDESLKYKKNSHRFDYGVLAGIGVFLMPRIALYANYELGFAGRNIQLGGGYFSVKNRGCSLMLSYIF